MRLSGVPPLLPAGEPGRHGQAGEPSEAAETAGAQGPAPVRDRPVPPFQGSPVWGWLGPILVAVFGAFLRFDHLARPKAVAFDETYYAKDALSLLRYGVERTFLGTEKDPIADRRLIAGRDDLWVTCTPDNL